MNVFKIIRYEWFSESTCQSVVLIHQIILRGERLHVAAPLVNLDLLSCVSSIYGTFVSSV